MTKHLAGWRVAGILFALVTAPFTLSAQEDSKYGVLVEGKGAEETYTYCSACHSERLVAQQGLTREGWSELMQWMVEEQGMAPIQEPDRTRILDYLAKNYGPDRPNFPYK